MRSKTDRRLLAVQLALAALAVLMLVIGIAREEVALVLTKAANICMECIGLG